MSTGRWSQAYAADTESQAIMQRIPGQGEHAVPMGRVELAVQHYYLDGPAQALPLLQGARDGVLTRFGEDSMVVQIATFYLATDLADLGRPAEALALLDRVHADALDGFASSQHWALRAAGLRGVLLMRLDQPAQGRAMAQDALARLQAAKAQAWMVQPLQAALDGKAAAGS
jgi:hypothetical protein